MEWKVAADVFEGVNFWVEFFYQFRHVVMEVELVVDVEAEQLHTFLVVDGSLVDVEFDSVVEAGEVGEIRFFDVRDEVD